MALSRAMLKGMNLTDEQVSAIIEEHTATVDGLKKQRDEYKARYGRMSAQLSEYKKAASQAYAFQKQVRDAHRERKQKRDERSL